MQCLALGFTVTLGLVGCAAGPSSVTSGAADSGYDARTMARIKGQAIRQGVRVICKRPAIPS